MQKNQDLSQRIARNEQILLSLWKEILGAEDISIESDFFQFGGDSLQMMTMLFRVSQETGVELEPGTVFENPALGQLALFITLEQQQRGLPEGATVEGTI